MALELRKHGLNVGQQVGIVVYYDGLPMGEYFADLLVNDLVIVEIKAIRDLGDNHIAQCLNYLKATGLKTALLINFGAPKIQVKRISL